MKNSRKKSALHKLHQTPLSAINVAEQDYRYLLFSFAAKLMDSIIKKKRTVKCDPIGIG